VIAHDSVAPPSPAAAMLDGLDLRAARTALTRARVAILCLLQLLGTLRTTGVATEVLVADQTEAAEALHRLALACAPVDYWRHPADQEARQVATMGCQGDPTPLEAHAGAVEAMLDRWATWVQARGTAPAEG